MSVCDCVGGMLEFAEGTDTVICVVCCGRIPSDLKIPFGLSGQYLAQVILFFSHLFLLSFQLMVSLTGLFFIPASLSLMFIFGLSIYLVFCLHHLGHSLRWCLSTPLSLSLSLCLSLSLSLSLSLRLCLLSHSEHSVSITPTPCN